MAHTPRNCGKGDKKKTKKFGGYENPLLFCVGGMKTLGIFKDLQPCLRYTILVRNPRIMVLPLSLTMYVHGWEIAVILRNFRKTKLSKSNFFFFFFFYSISTCTICDSTTFALRHTQISLSGILRHFRPPSLRLLLAHA